MTVACVRWAPIIGFGAVKLFCVVSVRGPYAPSATRWCYGVPLHRLAPDFLNLITSIVSEVLLT